MDCIKFTLLLFTILLYSCTGTNTTEGSPEDTMSGFIEKITTQDYQGAKEYTSNETDMVLDFMEKRVQMLKTMGKEDQIPALINNIDFSQVKFTCKTEGDKATCKCCEEITGNCNDITVIKEGGKWLIDSPKESTVEQE